MGAFKEPHGGELKNLYLDDAGAKARKGARARPAVVGPQHAPALRPRAAAERRLLAARRLHGRADYERCCRTCASRAACSGRCRSRSTCTQAFAEQARARRDDRAARPRGRADRHHDGHRASGARQAAPRRWRCSAPTTRRIPACATCTTMQARRLSRRHGAAASSRRCTTISSTCATRRRSCATASGSSAGAGSSRSRPATRCTARTRS